MGSRFENAHLETAYKGNYHLVATVGGKELKYIIRKGTPEHDALTRTGLSNLTEAMLKELAMQFLLQKV